MGVVPFSPKPRNENGGVSDASLGVFFAALPFVVDGVCVMLCVFLCDALLRGEDTCRFV